MKITLVEQDFVDRVRASLERHGCELVSARRRKGRTLELSGGHPYGVRKCIRVRVLYEAVGELETGTVTTAYDIAYRLRNKRSDRAVA